jgi:hypothetical protein
MKTIPNRIAEFNALPDAGGIHGDVSVPQGLFLRFCFALNHRVDEFFVAVVGHVGDCLALSPHLTISCFG